MFKKLTTSNTFAFTNKILHYLSYLLIIFLILGLLQSLWFSPVDYVQGHSVRIMYIHVPSSWLALSCFTLISILSGINFIFKIKNISLIGKSLAPVGFLFTIISIVTGSLWGKPTWGTLWAWDARLTSMVILGVFYLFYIFSWKVFSGFDKQDKISSLIAVVGLINIPIVKYSVVWWSTLHQPSSIKANLESSIHYSMLIPLILMFCALVVYFVIIFLMRYKVEVTKLKNKGLDRL